MTIFSYIKHGCADGFINNFSSVSLPIWLVLNLINLTNYSKKRVLKFLLLYKSNDTWSTSTVCCIINPMHYYIKDILCPYRGYNYCPQENERYFRTIGTYRRKSFVKIKCMTIKADCYMIEWILAIMIRCLLFIVQLYQAKRCYQMIS